MRATFPAIALALLVLFPPCHAAAAIYSYKDASGKTVFIDDAQKIPAQYRDSSTIIEERRVEPEPAGEAEGGDAGGQDAGGKDAQDRVKPAEPPAKMIIDRETQIRAREQAQMLDRERAHQTPVMVRGTRVLVPAEVGFGNGIAHLMLLLDTGATSTVLYRPALKELQLPAGEQVTTKAAGKRTIKSEKVVTRHFDVGPFLMKDYPLLLTTPQSTGLPFDGILGMDFLKDHPYEVDYRNEIIRWKPQK